MSGEPEQGNLIDWRIGYHIEAAAKILAASVYALSKSVDAQNARWDRIASAMERSNVLHEKDIELRMESQTIMESAQRMLTMLGEPTPTSPTEPRKPPEWIKDALKDRD